MKREESLLYIPIEKNSRTQKEFCDENESFSDFEDKSLLSVRISHDDTKDNENELLYQMNEASKEENTMESMLNASLKRNKKEVIISELNIEMSSTDNINKNKKICRNFNFDSLIKKKIFQFNKKINDSISKTNRSINQMTPKINVMSAKTKHILCKHTSHSNSPIKHINCHTSTFDANKNRPVYKVSSYRVKYHFPCIMNYKPFFNERNAKSKSKNKNKINIKKIYIKNKIHNVNTLLFRNKN